MISDIYRKKMNTKLFFNIVLSIMKSFWEATVFIASGISAFVILGAGLFYLRVNNVTNVPVYVSETLSYIISFSIDYWKVFWVVFFIIYFIEQFRRLE